MTLKDFQALFFISVLVLLAETLVPAAIIPDDRRIDWTQVGIPGGIPSRTTIYTTINAATYGNGTTDATNAIQAAINACPSGQVVFLPAGTYRVSVPNPANSATILNMRSNVTLRGAGMGKTILRYDSAYARSIIDIRGKIRSLEH